MLIVTAGSNHKPYSSIIRFCEEKCNKYGYAFKVYDLGGLGFGTPVDDLRLSSRFRVVRTGIKPALILDAMNNTDEELVVWIDGDATLMGSLDEIEADGSFDIGVTVRPRRGVKKTAYINAGVLFFKNNKVSKQFLQDWIETMGPPPLNTDKKPLKYSDQVVLEGKILSPAIGVPLWDVIDSVYEVNGARVKLFGCAQYNNFMCLGSDLHYNPSIKIIHFKGAKKLKKYALGAYNTFLLERKC